jgi:acetyl esterase/lipase
MASTVPTLDPATAPHNGAAKPSINVETRHNRSTLMHAGQLLVRCLRSQLSKGAPDHEAGSVRLSPPKSKIAPCTSTHRVVADINIYDIVPPAQPKAAPKKRIYYFVGGSWQRVPSPQHWWMVSKLAQRLPHTIVSIVSPPLAPNDPAARSFPACMALYRALMADAHAAGETVTFAGDSSGANMVLCLALEALREDAEAGVERPHPVSVMAICPSTDLTRSNSEIDSVAPFDPLLTPVMIRDTARAWCADSTDAAHPTVSPLNANVALLAKRGVKVHGVTAGYDVLCPDGVRFRDKCAEAGVKGEWLHWEKQMHCFVLMAPYRLSEPQMAIDWVVRVLEKE